jgi:hypothetical protein
MKRRCYLAYALAPAGVSAREANECFNDYIADDSRGIVVFHDHFVGEHGGLAVFDVRDDDEQARLADGEALRGWELRVHPLTFALTAVGFAAQVDFTLEQYRQTSLASLAAVEDDDPRFWWRRDG